MKIGLVGLGGSGKSTVYGALTGSDPTESHKTRIGSVKVPDPRVDAMAKIFEPKKTTYAEIAFTDLGGGRAGLDRAALIAMREVDVLCQVVRAFPDLAGEPADPVAEIADLETETILADQEIVERRVERLRKDRSDAAELALLERCLAAFDDGKPLRRVLDAAEIERLVIYRLLSVKPCLLVLNVAEDAVTDDPPAAVAAAAQERGLGLVVLSAKVESEIASLPEEEQGDYLEALGLDEPASHRFIRAAFATTHLISMLTVGPDECRAWPIPRGTKAPRAARSIHSDLERGFIRAEIIVWTDLVALGSEAKCREAGKARVEGKEYVVQDGDVIHVRFNV